MNVRFRPETLNCRLSEKDASGEFRPGEPAASPALPDVSREFIDAARRLPVSEPIICDIGSRDASEGLLLLNHLGGKELHIFEPNPAAADQCRATLAGLGEQRDKVVFNEVAVSDRDGLASFYPVDLEKSQNRDIGFSSLYKINPEYTKRRGRIVQSEILVKIVTLDSYFAGRDFPDILWIDVEGAELRVLQGATRILENVSLIHVEVALRPMQMGRPLYWEIDTYLRQHGFQFVSFVEVSWLRGLLYEYRLLPNLPWRLNAVYRRASGFA